MKEKVKLWFYRTFGKLENPIELDVILISAVALLIVAFFIFLRVIMTIP